MRHALGYHATGRGRERCAGRQQRALEQERHARPLRRDSRARARAQSFWHPFSLLLLVLFLPSPPFGYVSGPLFRRCALSPAPSPNARGSPLLRLDPMFPSHAPTASPPLNWRLCEMTVGIATDAIQKIRETPNTPNK